VDSGRLYNTKSTLPSSLILLESLIPHGEIGAPLSMYNNPFASQGCRPHSPSSLGRRHPHNNPSQRHQDISQCGNGYEWRSCAGLGQEVSDKGEGCQWKSLEWDAQTLHALQLSFSHQLASSEMTKQRHLQNVLVPAVAVGSQHVSEILDATGQPDVKGKCTHI